MTRRTDLRALLCCKDLAALVLAVGAIPVEAPPLLASSANSEMATERMSWASSSCQCNTPA